MAAAITVYSFVKVTRLAVRNYRSIFADDADEPVALDVVDGMNTLVGPNNCGKSNLLRALALALDPEAAIDRDRDMPCHYMFAVPWITVTVACNSKVSVEKTLLKYAEEYERSIKGPAGSTFADEGEVRLAVGFPGNDKGGGRRDERIQALGRGSIQGDPQKRQKVLAQLRRCYRFVSVESGQSLESLLTGKFREILHTVIQEHLKDEFAAADRRRSGYVESLQGELLDPLREGMTRIVADLFPEITDVILRPKVSTIDETLSDVEVVLRDAFESPLLSKGTGVRGGVTVAMLRYLAEHTRRSMVFAVEEPEAFLHPAAQEELRDDLDRLAERPDVTLFVSTHSPFIPSRRASAQIVSLSKTALGRTTISATARGDEPRASLLGDLFRDPALADVLERAGAVPSEAKAVVITEGDGDIASIRLAAERAGRAELLDGLHLSPAGGATKAIFHAVITRSQTSKPVIVLLDDDDIGRSAKETLKRLGWQNKKEVMTYGELFADGSGIEAEDLWPSARLEQFVAAGGEDAVLSGKWRRKDGGWHFDIRSTAKEQMGAFLQKEVTGTDCGQWIKLIELLRARAGL